MGRYYDGDSMEECIEDGEDGYMEMREQKMMNNKD